LAIAAFFAVFHGSSPSLMRVMTVHPKITIETTKLRIIYIWNTGVFQRILETRYQPVFRFSVVSSVMLLVTDQLECGQATNTISSQPLPLLRKLRCFPRNT
jgi:hypothetical protein